MAGQIIKREQPNTWLIRIFMGRDAQTGKRVYENKTVHGTKKAAEKELNAMLTDRDTGGFTGRSKGSIGTLLDDLLHDYRENNQRIDWAEMVVEKHLRPAFGHMGIAKFETDHARRYIAERKAKGRATATVNREMAILRRAFNLGRKTTPPKVLRVPYIPFSKEDNVRKGFLEHNEYLKLLTALPDELKPVLTFAYYTGCRRGEILALEWRQVDLLEKVIRLDPGTTKNDEPRVIPLAPELYQTLAIQHAIRQAEYPQCPWVFSRDGEQILSLRGSWETACKAAGLVSGEGEEAKPTKLFHDLRRTGVRNLVRAGVPERVAMAISGHKTRAIFDRYNITSESDLRDAARKLGAYMEQKTKQAQDRPEEVLTAQEPKSAPGQPN